MDFKLTNKKQITAAARALNELGETLEKRL